MGKWKKTACVLCALNCGIEVYIEDNKITKVKLKTINKVIFLKTFHFRFS